MSNPVCETLLPVFNAKVRGDLTAKVEKWPLENAFKGHMVNTLSEYEQTVEKFGLTINGLNSELYKLLGKTFEPKPAGFSNFFLFLVQVVEEYIRDVSEYLRGIYDFDGKVFAETKDFLMVVDQTIHEHAKNGNLDLLGIANLSNDLGTIHALGTYFSECIRKATDRPLALELSVGSIFSNTKSELEARLHTDYSLSLQFHLAGFISTKWEAKKLQDSPRQFVQELAYFLRNTLGNIRATNAAVGASLAFHSFREINKTLTDVFLHQAKHFNILDLANLKPELEFLIAVGEQDFFELDRLVEGLLPMMQFLNMFLVRHPKDYLDEALKREHFFRLGPDFLIKTIPNYNKKVVDGLPVVRKRECKAVVDALKLATLPQPAK